MEEAEKLFQSLDPQKKSFQFRHCWLQLRNQPKWHDKLQQMAAVKTSNKKQKVAKDLSPGLVDLTTQVGNEVSPVQIVPPNIAAPERPMGKKRSKEAMRKGGFDACSDALDILWEKKRRADVEKELKREERYAQAFALDKERLELEHKRLTIEEQKHTNEQKRLDQEKERLANEANNLYIKRIEEEQKIMSIDLTTMSELQRQYYMCLQADIVARRMN